MTGDTPMTDPVQRAVDRMNSLRGVIRASAPWPPEIGDPALIGELLSHIEALEAERARLIDPAGDEITRMLVSGKWVIRDGDEWFVPSRSGEDDYYDTAAEAIRAALDAPG